jgi:hypothetical protein
MNWMACDVEFTDEFGDWWGHLTAGEHFVPMAGRIYSRHLEQLQKEGEA